MIISSTLSNAEYHANPAVSASHLHAVDINPYHYFKRYIDSDRIVEPTVAMRFGSLAHTAILEPDELNKHYACCSSRKGSNQYNELVEKGIEPVSQSYWDQVHAMRDAVRSHPVVAWLLSEGKAEQSVFWHDDEFNLDCKCRPDWWNGSVIVDLKTTTDASPNAFAQSVHKYRYHCQQMHYLRGTSAERFIFIAVEKQYPYQVALYELDDDATDIGEALRQRDMKRIQLCKERNDWPGYSKEVELLSLPKHGNTISLHPYDL